MARTILGALRAVAIALLLVACASPGSTASPSPSVVSSPGASDGAPSVGPTTSTAPSGTLTLYTSVTQDTVDAVLAAYAVAYPDVSIDVFRAPTGELDARIAAERASGGVGADVLWGTDPLSVQAYASQDLFKAWTPAEVDAVPPAYHTDTFWGTRLLNMIIVYRDGVTPEPTDWTDLVDPAHAGRVAIPDPGFAGSAFGALGYFASSDAYGIDYYAALKQNGATQVQAIPEVLTSVAEGQYDLGMTLDKTARDAIAAGSPVHIAWPTSGAIAVYSPVAVFDSTDNPGAAESFANFLLTVEGQTAIADTGWQPIRDDVAGPEIGGPQVAPDWNAIFDRQEELLRDYRSIFGG